MREFSRLVLTNVPFSVLVAVYEVASVKPQNPICQSHRASPPFVQC